MNRTVRLPRTSLVRSAALVVAAAIPMSLLVLTPSAQAATEVGHLKLLPATGNQSNVLDIDTLVPCPSSSKNIRVEVYGTGVDPAIQNVMMAPRALSDTPADNEFGGYSLPLSEKFLDIFQANNVLHPSGVYTIKALCLDEAAFTVEAEITGSVLFSASASNFSGTYVQQSNAAATTTVLAAGPVDPVVVGTTSTLTAAVTPTNAAGSVQFKRGSTNIGSPVTVVAGQAIFTGAVPTGAGGLTAKFTPSDLDAFAISTSAPVDYVVVGPASVSGAARVGSTVSCSIASGGTITYAWTVDGVAVPSLTTASIVVPAGYLSKSLGCVATVTKNVTEIDSVSPTKTVALGGALKATTTPKVSGKAKVGKKLSCKHGSWSPKATTYEYQWLRKGKAIKHATKSKYKLTKKDKGKKVSCQVTATATGYAAGVAETKAKKAK